MSEKLATTSEELRILTTDADGGYLYNFLGEARSGLGANKSFAPSHIRKEGE